MKQLKTRSEVSPERKWNLQRIIPDKETFENIYNKCLELIEEVKKYKGGLNADNAIDCLRTEEELSRNVEKLYVYSHMKSDENTADNTYIELSEKCRMLAVNASSASSFINPELAKFPVSVLRKMQSDKRYSDYDIYLNDIIRNKKHLLSVKEESLLSNIPSFSSGYKTVFQLFNNADIKFDKVIADGEEINLTHGTYSLLLQNRNQEVRKQAFENMYKPYKAFTNTLAANYGGCVSKNVFFSRARKFPSCLKQALFSENIKPKVYDNLINCVTEYTPVLHEYVKFRKKALKLEENHMYDMYVPIVGEIDEKYDYDKAYDIVVQALYPLGEGYVGILKKAKTENWIDVEETQNKRSGAYSWGVYGVHPYVLLNHNGTLSDVFTIAHEMGHAVHSYYSNTSQPYSKAGYEIFVAEIASTVNEVLLIKHLLKTARGNKRKYLLSYYLDMFRTTLFRQTMFAEFEKFAHDAVENGQPLSSTRLSDYYYELNKKYYGDGVIHDDYIRYEWSRIPHFYNSFYVYKYATGLTCAVNIARKILKKNDYYKTYIEFLKSGGSDYPLNLLKKAGVDLTGKKAYDIAMKEFSRTLEALKRMYE